MARGEGGEVRSPVGSARQGCRRLTLDLFRLRLRLVVLMFVALVLPVLGSASRAGLAAAAASGAVAAEAAAAEAAAAEALVVLVLVWARAVGVVVVGRRHGFGQVNRTAAAPGHAPVESGGPGGGPGCVARGGIGRRRPVGCGPVAGVEAPGLLPLLPRGLAAAAFAAPFIG